MQTVSQCVLCRVNILSIKPYESFTIWLIILNSDVLALRLNIYRMQVYAICVYTHIVPVHIYWGTGWTGPTVPNTTASLEVRTWQNKIQEVFFFFFNKNYKTIELVNLARSF